MEWVREWDREWDREWVRAWVRDQAWDQGQGWGRIGTRTSRAIVGRRPAVIVEIGAALTTAAPIPRRRPSRMTMRMAKNRSSNHFASAMKSV